MTAGAARVPAPLRLAPHLMLAAFSAGLAASLVAGVAPWAGIAAVGVGATGAATAWRRRHAAIAVTLLAVTVCAAGWTWGHARLAATAPVALDLPVAVAGTVVVDTPPVPDGYGGHRACARADALRDADGAPVGRGVRLLLTLRGSGSPPPVGTRLRVAGDLRVAATRDSPDWWHRWLARQGISARMTPRFAVPVGHRDGAAGLRDRWRTWATENAAAGLRGDTAALVRGMALGGGSLLSQGAADAFRDAGIWHLLAVSGQNVTVVALATLTMLMALGVARRPGVAASALVMVAYCLACDGGASVARAGTVGALALAGELRSAPRDRWALLLAGLALLLAWQPRALGDPGLQLSFAAVVGLFALGPPIAAWARGWMPGPVADLAAMAAAAGLATAPVVAAHFGRLSLVGFALNVVAVPLAAPVVVLALCGLGLGALLPAAGVVCAWLAGLGADLLLLLARIAASVPGATVGVGGRAVPVLMGLAVAPWAVAAWLRRAPATPGQRRRALGICAAAALVAVTAWIVWPRPPVWEWPTRAAVTVLDIGQGDAILVRGPQGSAVLVDTGPPGEPPAVVDALRRHGVRRLDALVITHGDADHAGGATAVLDRIAVGLVVHPPEPVAGWGDLMRTALDAADADGVAATAVRTGDRLTSGPWSLDVLGPRGPLAAGAPTNDGSIVMRAQAAGFSALLTGDAESPVLEGLPLTRVDLLKVSHHGSADPGAGRLLTRLRPRAAVVSVGEGNTFGHPRAEVLAALDAAGAATWRTDRDGDITLVEDGGTLLAQTHRR